PGLLDAWAAGRSRFDEIGCSGCHVPTLELADPKLDARQPVEPGQVAFVIDVAKDGDGPRIEPKYGGYVTSYLVHAFSDLKRHDMGAALATPAPQGGAPGRGPVDRRRQAGQRRAELAGRLSPAGPAGASQRGRGARGLPPGRASPCVAPTRGRGAGLLPSRDARQSRREAHRGGR